MAATTQQRLFLQTAANVKKPPSAVLSHWPDSKLSLRADYSAEHLLRAGMFCENPDWPRGFKRTQPSSTGSAGASTIPRIWSRSINAR